MGSYVLSGPEIQGFLKKKGSSVFSRQKWQKRWFLIDHKCLYYYHWDDFRKANFLPLMEAGDPLSLKPLEIPLRPRCIVPLENIDVRPASDSTFEIVPMPPAVMKACKLPRNKRVVKASRDVYRVRADNKAQRNDWMEAICYQQSVKPTLQPSTKMGSYVLSGPEIQGFLEKKGSSVFSRQRWQKRWFLIDHKCLYYYHWDDFRKANFLPLMEAGDPLSLNPLEIPLRPRCIVPLENIDVRPASDSTFEIVPMPPAVMKACKLPRNKRVVKASRDVYRVRADNKAQRNDWMEAICRSRICNMNMLLEIQSKTQDSQRQAATCCV